MSPDTLDFISQTGNHMVAKPFSLEELLQIIRDPKEE